MKNQIKTLMKKQVRKGGRPKKAACIIIPRRDKYKKAEIIRYLDMKIDELTISANKRPNKDLDKYWNQIVALDQVKKDFELGKPGIFLQDKQFNGWNRQ